jgi:hypothetical protein
MSYKIKLLPEAHLDIKESIEWYNEQKAGLGKRFYESVKLRLDYIKKNPLHYQVSYRDVRNAMVNKFPHQVHYRVEESSKSIIVFGVTHTSRNPKVWKSRK